MMRFRFIPKTQIAIYVTLIIGAVLALIAMFNFNKSYYRYMIYIYSVIAILSYFLIQKSIKEAAKTFREIIVDEDKLSLTFQNKNKKKLEKQKSEVFYTSDEEKLEIWDKSSNELIGRAYKNRIEEKDRWRILIELSGSML